MKFIAINTCISAELVNTRRNYRQKGWLSCVPCLPCTVLLKDKELASCDTQKLFCSCYVSKRCIFDFNINKGISIFLRLSWAVEFWTWGFHKVVQLRVFRCGGMFDTDCVANSLLSPSVNFENQSAFGEVTGKSSVSWRFFSDATPGY